MLLDLSLETARQMRRADICVIGTGPAGLTVGRALAEHGLNVVLLEAGPQIAELIENPHDLRFDRSEYRGATLGRAFGFGGTSSLWGGQLLPILSGDMASRPQSGAPAWPIAYSEIENQFPTLESWLGVDSLPFNLEVARQFSLPMADLDWSGFSPRFSKWIPFSGRNLAAAWWDGIAATKKAQCWLNATACDWQGNSRTGRIESVIAKTESGHSLSIKADEFIIAAGAIESARLLLEMQAQTDCPSAFNSSLGGFLQDHLSIRIGEVEIRDRPAFQGMFAPFFIGATMRSPRLEISPAFARDHDLPALYAHFVTDVDENSGFAFVRETLRALQKRRVKDLLAKIPGIPAAIPGVAEIAYWRYCKGRLPFPSGSRIYLHVDFEQHAVAENRVSLGSAAGPLGRKHAHISWHPGIQPVSMVQNMTDHLRAFWTRNALDRIAGLRFYPAEMVRSAWPTNLYDIYHPAGTSRMARTPDEGVVDPNLRVFGTQNVHVLSTSVFPSMGAANPTFTLMALGLRLAEHLAQPQLERSPARAA